MESSPGLPLHSAKDRAPALAPKPEKRKLRVFAWGLWDWGGASFNAVMTTFVFTVYLTSESFGGSSHASGVLSLGMGIAGVVIALSAPITGMRADGSGKRKFWLGVNTSAVVILTACCFFVCPSQQFLLLGVALIAAGNVFFEFAGVSYNAMLSQISTPSTAGKISGFGWALGYCGGIVVLSLVLVSFVLPDVGLFGVTKENGLNIRAVALFSALWFALFSLPVFFAIPEVPAEPGHVRVGIGESYRLLWRRLRELFRTDRNTGLFLVASAVFRDGFAAVFAFGGIIAAGTFAFTQQQVILFAIVGNVVAALGAVLGGLLDARISSKRIIIISLAGLILAAVVVVVLGAGSYRVGGFAWDGTLTFWVCGLLLCLFVGPAQSAARTFLSSLAPVHKQGEIFGLYATAGRAVSFLAPLLFSFFLTALGQQRFGIIGIVIVLGLGLLLLLPVKSPLRRAVGAAEEG